MTGPEPVGVMGEIETEAAGLAYGAMVFDVEPGGASAPHRHASEEIWLVQEGVGRAVVDGREFGLIAGTRFTVPAGVLHCVANEGSGPLRVMSFWWRPA